MSKPTAKSPTRRPGADEELRFRELLDHAVEGILMFAGDGTCRYANPAARKLLGVTGALDKFDCPEIWRSRVRQVMSAGHPMTFDEYVPGAGGPVMVESSWAPWPDDAGRVAGVSCIYRDVTERQRLAVERRLLAQRLLEVQEQERKNISDFLHDHMGPIVIMAKIDLERLARGLNPAQQALLQPVMSRLDEALRGIRHKALDVRPPLLDDLEVKEALEFLVEEFTRAHDLKVNLAPVPRVPSLTPAIKTCLFRILQEVLNNVDAHATTVTVQVEERGQTLVMTISDDGRGFEAQSVAPGQRVGLLGMREIVNSLGGDLRLISQPGQGTRVEVVVPMDEEKT